MINPFFHHIFVAPAVRWIVSPYRRNMWSPSVGIIVALTFLAVLAGYEIQRPSLNCFEELGLSAPSDGGYPVKSEITKAFRQQSLLYHPDKNPSKEAEQRFIHLRQCFDTVTDRVSYNEYKRFGEMRDPRDSTPEEHYPYLAVVSLAHYALNFIFAMLFTLAPEHRRGRYWFFLYTLFTFCSEMLMKFLGEDLFTFLPWWLIFEKIQALQNVMPSVLQGAILMAGATFSDEQEQAALMLREVAASNLALALHLKGEAERSFSVKEAQEGRSRAGNNVPHPAAVRLALKGMDIRKLVDAAQSEKMKQAVLADLKEERGPEEKKEEEGSKDTGEAEAAGEEEGKAGEPKGDARQSGGLQGLMRKGFSYLFYYMLLKSFMESVVGVKLPSISSLLGGLSFCHIEENEETFLKSQQAEKKEVSKMVPERIQLLKAEQTAEVSRTGAGEEGRELLRECEYWEGEYAKSSLRFRGGAEQCSSDRVPSGGHPQDFQILSVERGENREPSISDEARGGEWVEICRTDKYGRILRAAKRFKRGDVVFREHPLLCSWEGKLSSEDLEPVQNYLRQSPMDIEPEFRFLKGFCALKEEQRQAVLDCYSPSSLEVSSSSMLTEVLQAARIAKKRPWAEEVPLQDLEKVVLVKACNAHSFYAQSKDSCALFRLASKMRHSCATNVTYSSRREEGWGVFVAKQDIEAGEELTFAYIQLADCLGQRKAVLKDSYLFECSCCVCRAVDSYGALPCPSCSERYWGRGEEEEERVLSDQFVEKGLCRNESTAAPFVYFHPSLDAWVCEGCGSSFVSSSMDAMIPPRKIECLYEGFQRLPSSEQFCHDISSIAFQVRRGIWNTLGPRHALSLAAECRSLDWEICRFFGERGGGEEEVEKVISRTDDLIALLERAKKFVGQESAAGFLENLLTRIPAFLVFKGRYEKAIEYLQMQREELKVLFRPSDVPLQEVEACLEAAEKRDPSLMPLNIREAVCCRLESRRGEEG